MITIVTGKINEGKTTTLTEYFIEHHAGDGFISIKKMIGTKVHSFISTRLTTREQKTLLVHELYYANSFASKGKIGPYYINLLTLDWICKSIEKMIQEKIEPIYLDEIGLLELKGHGYYHILRKMVESNLDLIISAREDLVERIIRTFRLKDVHIVKVNR
ncbi:MAG: nucleoside-triphosphatase [Firmicutes bacterium]|nr:nucleoside-triphosphatase [Bacillota bacterium]